MQMVVVHAQQASEALIKLIIVAIGTHGNNGGTKIAMLLLQSSYISSHTR